MCDLWCSVFPYVLINVHSFVNDRVPLCIAILCRQTDIVGKYILGPESRPVSPGYVGLLEIFLIFSYVYQFIVCNHRNPQSILLTLLCPVLSNTRVSPRGQ